MRVTFKNITKKFGDVIAVSNFSAEIADGQLVCLLGPSGCGKSTLLNMLCGIYPVTEGQIFFDDQDVTKLPIDLRNVGMVFQNYALYPHMTVLENICFPLEIQKVPKKLRIQKAQEIARLVHIDQYLKRYPKELSGGQQQRVAIARALVKSPSLLLMDEPLSNLDARLRIEMREEIRRIQTETKVTTIFVTHDQEEALSISDQIFLMKDGILEQWGKGQDLYKQPVNRFVAEFLGNPPVNQISGTEFGIFISKMLTKSDNFRSKISEISDFSAYTLEIRPESFTLVDRITDVNQIKAVQPDSCLSAEISQIYEMGKEKIAYLKFTEEGKVLSLRAILNVDQDFQTGETVSIKLKTSGVFLFKTESGERVL